MYAEYTRSPREPITKNRENAVRTAIKPLWFVLLSAVSGGVKPGSNVGEGKAAAIADSAVYAEGHSILFGSGPGYIYSNERINQKAREFEKEKLGGPDYEKCILSLALLDCYHCHWDFTQPRLI